MDRTFATMKSRMGLWLGVDRDSSTPNYTRFPEALREDFINEARRNIALRRDLRFFEASATVTTVAGTAAYDLPTRYLRPYHVYFLDSSNNVQEPDQIHYSLYNRTYADDVAADRAAPSEFATFGEYVYFGPVPDAVYSIYVKYYQQPADLSTGSATDDFFDIGWRAILFEACFIACDYLMEDSRRQLFEYRAQRELGFLSANDRRARISASSPQNNTSAQRRND